MIIEVLDAEDYDDNKMLVATNITQNGETTKVAYIIPKEAIEWRIAEYDLDPNDTETALDILLHSPHIDIPEGERLYDGITVEQARNALLSRVRAKREESDKQKAARAVAAGGTTLRKAGIDPEVAARGKMLGLLHRDPEVIAVKREIIAVHRQQADEERAKAKAKPARDRVADLKQQLEGMKNAAGTDI